MTKKISVIVPVYRAEKYIENCIASIVNQTYKNLEIILVDDGSPDNCPKICDAWAKKDDRIVVIHKENGGVSSARNKGLDVATGDYITFVDSDDFIEDDMLSSLFNAIGDAQMAVCGFTFDYPDGRQSKVINSEDKIFSNPLKDYIDDKIRPEACGKLISASAIGDIRFDYRFGYSEDVLFNYFVVKNCNKVAVISSPLYHYMQDSGNSSTTALITDARSQSYRVFQIIADDCKGDDVLYHSATALFTTRSFAVLTRVMMVKEFEQKYFDEIADAILARKSNIFKNSNLGKKYKVSVFIISLSKGLFKKIYRFIGR